MNVFISSTFSDKMKTIRDELQSSINNYSNYNLTDLSSEIVQDTLEKNVIEASIDGVKGCEYFILLLDEVESKIKFSIDKNDRNKLNSGISSVKIKYNLSAYFQDDEKLSVTHLEFRIAKALGKYIFVFSVDNAKNNSIYKEACNYKSSQCIDIRDYKSISCDILLTIFHDYYEKIENRYRIVKFVDDCEKHFNIITHIGQSGKDISEIRDIAINSKYIDSKYLYMSEKSVKAWQQWELNNSINTVNGAFESFKKVFESDSLSGIAREIDTIVDLGTGKGEKLDFVLKTLNNHYYNYIKDGVLLNHLNIIPVDYSINMLDDAIDTLNRYTRTMSPIKDYVTIDGLKIDMMQLNKAKTLLCGSKGKSTLYMLLGGTLGNLNEKRFIQNLKDVCEDGDYFIVTIFLYNSDSSIDNMLPDYTEVIKAIYSHSLKDLRFTIDKVCMCKDEKQKDSDKYDVEVRVDLKDMESDNIYKNISILKSTRYKESYMDSFFKDYNFRIVKSQLDAKKVTKTYLLRFGKKQDGC